MAKAMVGLQELLEGLHLDPLPRPARLVERRDGQRQSPDEAATVERSARSFVERLHLSITWYKEH